MSINDKIKQLLKDKNLTPSVFADEIGVNRASISHILSGRNRPSYDIIQKILRRFPDLGFEWMLEDEESSTVVNNPIQQINSQTARRLNLQPEIKPSLTTTNQSTIPQTSLSATSLDEKPSLKTIERILIFYTDGTFKEYSPS